VTKIPRQYIVTHLATGEQTVVNAFVYWYEIRPHDWSKPCEVVARKLGYRYPADCEVRLVRQGHEYALPFDELPLVIKRANVSERAAPAA